MAGEKNLEDRFIRQAKLRGLKPIKFTADGETGMPDRVLLGDHPLVWWAEIKTTKKTASKRQQFVHKEFAGRNWKVWLIDTNELLDEFFKEVDNDIRSARLSGTR